MLCVLRVDAGASNMRSSEAGIRKANECMAAGKVEEAKLALQSILHSFPAEKGIYHDAVNIYLAGKLFDEAIAVFGLYKEKFGEDLHTDFTLEEIQREKKLHDSATRYYESAKAKVFRRMSIFARGRFSNLPMVFPVKEIAVSSDGIAFKKGGQEYRYRWTEINNVYIRSREGYKGYFLGEDVIRTLHIEAHGRTFRIDISTKYPDFKDSDILVQELGKHFDLKEKGRH